MTQAELWPAPGQAPVEIFRSSSGRGLAVAWWAVSAFALADLVLHGRDHTALRIGLGIAITDLLVWLGGWRPAVLLYPAQVVLRGSVRDRAVALRAVTAATAVGPLRLRADGKVFTAASIGSTVRERRRADRAAASVPARAGGGFGGARRGGGLLGGLGSRAPTGPTSPGFDDSRMDAATREALIGRTPGAHAADRISDEARRLRARSSADSDSGAGGAGGDAEPAVSGGRFAPVPALAALLGVVALLVLLLV